MILECVFRGLTVPTNKEGLLGSQCNQILGENNTDENLNDRLPMWQSLYGNKDRVRDTDGNMSDTDRDVSDTHNRFDKDLEESAVIQPSMEKPYPGANRIKKEAVSKSNTIVASTAFPTIYKRSNGTCTGPGNNVFDTGSDTNS